MGILLWIVIAVVVVLIIVALVLVMRHKNKVVQGVASTPERVPKMTINAFGA